MQPVTPHMIRVPHSKLGTHAQKEAWRSKAEGRAQNPSLARLVYLGISHVAGRQIARE
jgi:hypothetical protein